MLYTSDQLATLKAAYASGVRRVKYADGKEVEYYTMRDMAAAIAMIERELAQQAGGAQVTYTTAVFSRGM